MGPIWSFQNKLPFLTSGKAECREGAFPSSPPLVTLQSFWGASAVPKTPKLMSPPAPTRPPRWGAQVGCHGALQMRVPRGHFPVCRHTGRKSASSPPGSFQISRNFYGQRRRPFDCKSSHCRKIFHRALPCHNRDATEVRPLSPLPTCITTNTWNYYLNRTYY